MAGEREFPEGLSEEERRRLEELAYFQELKEEEYRHGLGGESFSQWQDTLRRQAQLAATGEEFKQAIEKDHHLLSREGSKIIITSAAGVYTTPLDISLTGAATDQEFDKFASSIKRDQLPTTREVQDTNDFYRWKQFAIIASSDAEVYKRRIENEFGHVLARRDDRVLIVTPEGVADDLQRLTPEIADYKNLVAALDIQKLPSVAEAQALQAQRIARKEAEVYDLSDEQLSYYPDPPESWDQINEQRIERAEFKYHRGEWVDELQAIAAKSRNAGDFKTAIEAAGNILARGAFGLMILGEKPAGYDEGWRYSAAFTAALTGKSDEEFNKLASAINAIKLPSEEDARHILESQQNALDAKRAVSTHIIHDLTSTAKDAKDFQYGLLEQAMILAREGEGKSAQFAVVDYDRQKYTLARLVAPLRATEFNAMMAALDIQKLPTVAQAKAEQAQAEESSQNPSRTIELRVYSPPTPAPKSAQPAPQPAQAANDNLVEREQMTPQERAEELAGFAPTLKLSELKEAAEDPQLEELLNDLSARQAKQALDLAHKHEREREVFGSPTSSQEDRQREFLEQAREFDKERERYIAEYKESKAILDEMREDEKLREQERGDSTDDDRGVSR